MAQLVKNPLAVGETWVQSLGWKGYPFQHSGLENSMDCIGLSNFHFTDGEFGFGHVESFNHFREEGSWLVNIQFLT